jgi:hypothetical protein
MKQLKNIAPAIIVLLLVLVSSVVFGLVNGNNQQNEQALLAALNIFASETAAPADATTREASRTNTQVANTQNENLPPDDLGHRVTNNDVLTDSEVSKSNAQSDLPDFYFLYNGVTFELGQSVSDIVEQLEQAKDFYSSASCAFEGDEKIYVYEGFEITTYMRDANDIDRLYSVTFLDDSVATREGVRIGQSYEEMIAAYGADFEEVPGRYLYISKGIVLSFSFEDEIISSIMYFVEDIFEYEVADY